MARGECAPPRFTAIHAGHCEVSAPGLSEQLPLGSASTMVRGGSDVRAVVT